MCGRLTGGLRRGQRTIAKTNSRSAAVIVVVSECIKAFEKHGPDLGQARGANASPNTSQHSCSRSLTLMYPHGRLLLY